MWFYVAFIIGIASSRLYEVYLSKHYLRLAQKEEDAHEIPEGVYSWMVLFHASWLLACVVEVIILNRPFFPFWGTLMLMGWGLAFTARIFMLKTMKDSWNVRIIHRSQQKVISTGFYRYIRHPNYLIVIIEIFCVPLIHNAYLTAGIGSCLNGLLIWKRLQQEETYLASLPEYNQKLGHLPRFIPRAVANFFKKSK